MLYQKSITTEKSFATLFKLYRLRSAFATVSEFGKVLAEEGFIFEDSIFSRWQRGSRIPKNRKLLLCIIKVFIKKEGIISLQDVNEFLESAGQGYITDRELEILFSTIHVSFLK